ncbi:MAG TPA: hypothetical protein VK066_11300 [Chloroflexota bacterium]|nr:hypothetical protein [Chloroflexota bacterium]
MPPPQLASVDGAPSHASCQRPWGRLALLGGTGVAALAALGLLVLGGLGQRLPWGPWRSAGLPPFKEVVYQHPLTVLGRDFVIAPTDATPDQIERVLLAVADEDTSAVLRLNLFTSEEAAQTRRQLIATGVYPRSEDDYDGADPDPPEWAAVYPYYVGIYTRDPARQVHQLSICLDDPDHSHCTVRRYPLPAGR